MPNKERGQRPGKTFPSKYEQDVAERVDFRMRMRAELKAMARDSFMEEIERMKHVHPQVPSLVNNNSFDALENERTQQLEQEVLRLNQVVEELRLNQVVEELRQSQGLPGQGAPSMQCEWASPFSRDQRLPAKPSSLLYGEDAFSASPRGRETGTAMMFASSSPMTMHAHSHTQNNTTTNNMFVLSCAPINAFNKVISQQEDAFLGPQLSLVEQAQRFAEMQSLFHLPAHLPPDDPLFAQQLQRERDAERERMERAAQAKAQKEKLQSTIETHRDRLEKSRNPPRRFPMDAKPSMQSPRARVHGRARSQENPLSLSLPGPLSARNADESSSSAAPLGSVSARSAPTTEKNTNNTSNNSSNNDSSAVQNNESAPPATANAERETKKPKAISAEEFEQKTKKLNEDLRSMVRQVVQEEMLADAQAQHYTKRMQNKLIATKQDTLVGRIEKSVADKIQQLQKELEELKEQRVKGKTRSSLLMGDGDEDGGALGALLASLNAAEGVDGKALSTEINRSVEATLRRFLSPERVTHHERSSVKMTGHADETTMANKEAMMVEKPPSTRIHGRISANTYTPSFDAPKDSIGFDSPSVDHSSPTSGHNPATTDGPAASNTFSEMPVDEPPVVKPKSKAERLLGVSTDVKSGLPVNDPLTSSKQGGNGLFGSIGSLFSAKPGSGQSAGQGLVSGFGLSSRPVSSMHPSPTMNRHTLVTIMDEGVEEASDKNSQSSSSKHRNKKKDNSGHRDSFSSSDASSKNGPQSPAPVMNPQLVAEIANEEANYRALMSNVLSLADVKVNIKTELKDWQIDFQNKYGRVPTVEDKMAINDRFIAYKMVCTQVQEAKDLVKASEDKLKELREKLNSPQ